LDNRVFGRNDAVGGTDDKSEGPPFARTVLHQVVIGQAGQTSTRVICASRDVIEPLLFDPDGRVLAAQQGATTYLLPVGGGRAMTPFLSGRILDWVAVPTA
jgi:hypothetical protein